MARITFETSRGTTYTFANAEVVNVEPTTGIPDRQNRIEYTVTISSAPATTPFEGYLTIQEPVG